MERSEKRILEFETYEELYDVLEKLMDNQSELHSLSECEVFVRGFRLGARIMLEVLDGRDRWEVEED